MDDSREAYNLRQYDLMLRTIELYRSGSISFGQLIANLEALRGALKDPTESWASEFESLWGKLEDTHAVMLDEGRKEFDDFDRRLVESSLTKLESLIKTPIDSLEAL